MNFLNPQKVHFLPIIVSAVLPWDFFNPVKIPIDWFKLGYDITHLDEFNEDGNNPYDLTIDNYDLQRLSRNCAKEHDPNPNYSDDDLLGMD